MKFLDCCKKSGSKVNEFVGEKKYIATGDVSNDEIVSFSNVTFSNKPSRANVMIKENSILFAKMKSTNKVLFGNEENVDNIYSTGFYCITADETLIKPRLLFHYIKSDKFNISKDKYCEGATMKSLNDSGLSKIDIKIPDFSKQDNLIQILDYIDEAIKINENNIKENDKLIKSKYSEMFDNCSEKIKIGDACSIKARIGWQGLTKKEYLTSGEYLLVTGVDFVDDKIDFDNCYFVSKDRYEQDENIQLKNGDVLVTKDGTIGKIAIVENLSMPATLNSGVFVVRDKTGKLNSRFLEYSLLSYKFTRFIDSIKTGATISHLNQAAFVKYEIPFPSEEEQEYFLTFVEKIKELNELNKVNIIDLKNLKETIINNNF